MADRAHDRAGPGDLDRGPDTRHAHKTRERRQDGFKAHVVVEPDTGLTTVEADQDQRPGQPDANVGAELVTTDATVAAEDHLEVLGDSAYATGDMLHTLHGKKWTPLLKPWPIKPAVQDGFTIDDFVHDPATDGDLPGRSDPADHQDPWPCSGSPAASVR